MTGIALYKQGFTILMSFDCKDKEIVMKKYSNLSVPSITKIILTAYRKSRQDLPTPLFPMRSSLNR